jgi:hypothetical protein
LTFTFANCKFSADKAPSKEDLRLLSWQLGRPVRGVLAVKLCPHGFPQLILNHPLLLTSEKGERDLEPMPTIFWLTCPFLVEEVAKLESAGGVKRYERLLENDEELFREYLAAHQTYREMRLSLLSQEELKYAKEKGLRSILESGIAGIMNPKRVKCLHAQLAHFLATGQNPIGRLVAQELATLACPDQQCASFPAGAQTG